MKKSDFVKVGNSQNVRMVNGIVRDIVLGFGDIIPTGEYDKS